MQILQFIGSLLLFILSLSVLIIIHELGHLSMAKLFKIYCQEFSVGFGPALLHKRKEGKETYFSIRAIPLGGYVSMFGEGVTLEDGVNIPQSRSLEGVKRYKKAIVVSAGIILNAVLGLVLFSISNICFPLTQVTSSMSVDQSSLVYQLGVRDEDKLGFVGATDDYYVYIDEEINGTRYQGAFYILDDEVTYNGENYVLCWYPTLNSREPKFNECMHLMQADKEDKIKNLSTFARWQENGVVLKNYPDVTKSELSAYDGVSIEIDLLTHKYLGEDNYDENISSYKVTISSVKQGDKYVWGDPGISFKLRNYWLPFGTRIKNTFIDFGEASVAVIKGIASLFTGGIQNMSGIVGIFSMSSEILSNYTFNTYIYLWGLISVNLALFNLIPFPGLDGWALLVTAIESGVNFVRRRSKKHIDEKGNYLEWKIPSKVKNIVSNVGLALLFILMIAIVGLDIARLIG